MADDQQNAEELEQSQNSIAIDDTGYDPEEHANGKGKGPDPMYFAEGIDREMTDIQQDPAALFREMLGPGENVFDLFMRTRWQDEEQLNRAVNMHVKNFNSLKRAKLFKGHNFEHLTADLFGMHLKMYGLIGMNGDARYEFLQANANVVVAEKDRDGAYGKRSKPVGRERE